MRTKNRIYETKALRTQTGRTVIGGWGGETVRAGQGGGRRQRRPQRGGPNRRQGPSPLPPQGTSRGLEASLPLPGFRVLLVEGGTGRGGSGF